MTLHVYFIHTEWFCFIQPEWKHGSHLYSINQKNETAFSRMSRTFRTISIATHPPKATVFPVALCFYWRFYSGCFVKKWERFNTFLVWIISQENWRKLKKVNNSSGRKPSLSALQKSVNQFIEEQKKKQTLACSPSFWNPSKKKEKNRRDTTTTGTQWFSEWVYSYCQRKDGGDYEPSLASEGLQRPSIVTWKRSVFKEHRRRSRVWANEEGAGCSLQTPETRMQANRNRPFKAEAIAMAKKEFFTRVTYWESRVPRL